MTLTPRPYHGIEDFVHLDAILASAGQAGGCPYYVHPGDLRWWLFYTFPEDAPWANLHLWEDAHGRPCAWTLLSPQEAALDVFCLPEVHHSPELERLLRWGVERLKGLLRQSGETCLYKWWNHPQDACLLAALHACGFAPGDARSVVLTHPLDAPLPEPALPAGFTLRPSRGLAELESRAAAQHSAFESDVPMERYLQRFRRFMASPVYDSEQDVVIEAPDGSIAAFAKIWLDPATHTGNFEPVGVHAAYQRRGLGRAVMFAGLRRMQAGGMHTAKVGTGEANTPAIQLYESAGFQTAACLQAYTMELGPNLEADD